MSSTNKNFLIPVLIFVSTFIVKCKMHHINKRSLLFPQYTILQVTYGVSAPLILPKRSINFSVCMQCNFELPYNVSNLRTQSIVAVRSADEIDYDLDRTTFYKYIVGFLDSFGLEGEKCLLRSICEVAEVPMHVEESNSLLESIAHYLLTPSQDLLTSQMGNLSYNSTKNRFLAAEDLGKTNGKCHEEFSECSLSLVDLFTKMFHV